VAFYQYKAINGNGTVANGDIEAGGRQDAFRKMEALGLKPIKLIEKESKSAGKPSSDGSVMLPWKSSRITFKMLENFTRLLSSLLSAGVPLSRGKQEKRPGSL